MGAAISLIAILVLLAVSIFLLVNISKNFRPGRSKIQKDIALIKAELQPWLSDLVPWSAEEMEQLSLNQINRKNTRGVAQTAKGIFTTVYHEPLIAWVYKKYVSKKENALIYARSSQHEFIYRLKSAEAEIVANNKLLGKLDANGRLIPAKGSNLLAQINQQTEGLILPVTVNGKQVGGVVKANKSEKKTGRAFQLVTKMSPEEEEMFLALGVLEMVKRSV